MNFIQFKQKINSLTWNKWANRTFSPFFGSLFLDGIKKEYFAKIGASPVDMKAQLFQNWFWYESPQVWEDMSKKLNIYLKHKSIFDITKSLAEFYKINQKRVKQLSKQKNDLTEALAEFYDIISHCVAFIWLAHGLEVVYRDRLGQEVPKYIQTDIDKFIGDASFPKKKNAHAKMEAELRKGASIKNIAKKYGWINCRGNFDEPFSEGEIKKLAQSLKEEQKFIRPKIPQPLVPLFKQMQELVFFRTERTDIFYELIYLARPLFKRVAASYQIPFTEFKFYTIQSLIAGKPQRLNMKYSFGTYEKDSYLGNEFLVEEEKVLQADAVKGTVAFPGKVKGRVKIVHEVKELYKVEVGDILVTQMTFPAFISAMHKAIAFVTDEGGITCHAAIVAREMKKPCITGTKIATKVFKDGDLVEVDADKGVVKKYG